MYERMQQDVGNELSKLVGYSACICRGFGMPSDAEDVLQDVFRSMSETGRRNPKFAATVCSMPSEELHAYVKKAIRNAARRLSEKSEADARKRRAWAEERAVCGRTGPAPDVAQAWDKDNALRVLRLVTAKLDRKGGFALTVILSGKSAERNAADFGISERTGRRWYRCGVRVLRKVIEQVLGHEFGDEAVREFIRLAAICQETGDAEGPEHCV